MSNCSFCNRIFSDEENINLTPKLLDCLHTFCVSCLRDLVRTNDEISAIQCPLCNTITTDSTNFGIASVLNLKTNFLCLTSNKGHQNSTCYNCCLCHHTEATYQCLECNNSLYCTDCSEEHENQENHDLLALNKKSIKTDNVQFNIQQMCNKHTSQDISIYCIKCKIIICLTCAIFDHKDHNYHRIEELAPVTRVQLQGSISSTSTKLDEILDYQQQLNFVTDNIEEQNFKTQQEITRVFENLIKILKNKQNELLEKQKLIFQNIKQQIDDKEKYLINLENTFGDSISYASKVITSGSDLQVMDHFSLIENRLTTLDNLTINTDMPYLCSKENPLIYLVVPEKELQQLLSQIGMFNGDPESAHPKHCTLLPLDNNNKYSSNNNNNNENDNTTTTTSTNNNDNDKNATTSSSTSNHTINYKLTEKGWKCTFRLFLNDNKKRPLIHSYVPLDIKITNIGNNNNNNNNLLGSNLPTNSLHNNNSNISDTSNPTNSEILPELINNQNGTIDISFTTFLSGHYILTVDIFGEPISNSPYSYHFILPKASLLWGMNQGVILQYSSIWENDVSNYSPENLRLFNTTNSWLGNTSGEEYIEFGLSGGACLVERIEILTFYASEFILSYRLSTSTSKQWSRFEATPDWTELPIGLGNMFTIYIHDEERMKMGSIDTIQLKLNNSSKKMTSFCAFNVFGWSST